MRRQSVHGLTMLPAAPPSESLWKPAAERTGDGASEEQSHKQNSWHSLLFTDFTPFCINIRQPVGASSRRTHSQTPLTNPAFASSVPAPALTHPNTASRCPCTLLREPVRKARGPANQGHKRSKSSSHQRLQLQFHTLTFETHHLSSHHAERNHPEAGERREFSGGMR